MDLIQKTKTAQQIYIDAIYKSCMKWANWNPPIRIEVSVEAGDFGTIEQTTGKFMVEGNIYSHPDIQAIASQYPAVHCAADDVFCVNSDQAQVLKKIKPEGTVVQDIVFQAQLKFSNKQAAVLLMHNAEMIHVPKAFFHAAAASLSTLKGKVVAHEVWHCHGYFLNLSNQGGELRVALHSHAITSPGPEVGTGFRWIAKGLSGVYHYGYQPEALYTPLFNLMAIM
ncbi:hypothetical protein BC826DRAFT_920676 [Russula brevipes]|nr:hypothetical protein BC826DRAFT_920676 [Russula brevipes]